MPLQKRVSDLPAVTGVTGTDLLIMSSSSATKRVTVSQIGSFFQAAGVAGPTGPSGGPTGPAGPPAGVQFIYSSTTTASDPTSGRFRFNNGNLLSTAFIYLDDEASVGGDVQPLVRTWDDSSSVFKGFLSLTDVTNPSRWTVFRVLSVTEYTGWFSVGVTNIDSSVPFFTDGDSIAFAFSRTGDKGDTGSTGPSGSGEAYQTATAPVSAAAGATWLDTDTGRYFVRYDATWIEVGG